MLKNRKVIIALIAVVVVIIAFMIVSNRDGSNLAKKTQDYDSQVLDRPDFTDLMSVDGKTIIHKATRSGFITRDPVTKKPVRKFGFEKLLNPEKNSEKWRLKKPYMHFYGDNFECRIESDEGNFQVQRIMNKLSPRNARLYGNVLLKIKFLNEGSTSDGIIYLEDLDYDSERSELHTDKSVRAVFDDAEMEGTGMTLIYNSAKSRIEYFDLKDLDFIKLHNIASVSQDRKDGNNDPANAKNTAGTESNIENNTDSSITTAAADTGENNSADPKTEEPDYYHCRFLKDVKIEYGKELVVTALDQLNIMNLIFTQDGPESTPPDDTTENTAKADEPSENIQPVLADSSNNADPAGTDPVTADASADEDAKEVIVTCKEGFVVQLMSSINADYPAVPPVTMTLSETLADIKEKAESKNTAHHHVSSKDYGLIAAAVPVKMGLSEPTAEYAAFTEDLSPEAAVYRKPTRFRAQKIDYDMTTKNAYANGPINMLIYAKPDPNEGPDQKQIPINITAQDSCEYFGGRDQFVFKGDVKGMRRETGELYVTENSVEGDELVVDLDSAAKENNIRHLAVLGENVRMRSERKSEDQPQSIILLQAQRIDYEASEEIIVAKGPGVIEIDNSRSKPSSPADKKENTQISLKEPCYGYIEDFDSLKWNTKKNRLFADGTSDSVKIHHTPVIAVEPEEKYGKYTYAAARHIEAAFTTTNKGRTELASIKASKTVTFKEKQDDLVFNNFIGDSLYYNAEQGVMLVRGTKDNPCFANGVNTDIITYNLATGDVDLDVSAPSLVQFPPKPKDLDKR